MFQKRIVLQVILLFPYLITVFGIDKHLYNSGEGLSNSLINDVCQDHLGFIWVATENGLNRFDGMKFKSFFHVGGDVKSLKDNYVATIAEDNKGNLLVGQLNGLQRYDFRSETFEEIELYVADERIHHYISSIVTSYTGDTWVATSGYGLIKLDKTTGQPSHSPKLNNQLCSIYLRCLFEDSNGILWIGSDDNGVNSYNPETGEIKAYNIPGEFSRNVSSNIVSSICEGDDGFIYVGCLGSGLFRINMQTDEIEPIKSSLPKEANMSVKCMLLDSKKRLWVGTDGYGLKLFNPSSKLLETYVLNNPSFDFTKAKVHSIMEDNGGNIWLGLFQKGLYLIPSTPELFNYYGNNPFAKNNIGSSCITSIEGGNGAIWFGTDSDGIYRIEKKGKTVQHYPLYDNVRKTEVKNILALCNDSNYLWIGTYSNGLIRFDKRTGGIKGYNNNPNDSSSLVSNNITTIKKGNDGYLYIGTLGGSLCRFDPSTGKCLRGLDMPDSLNKKLPQWINHLYFDEKQDLWIGTYIGLFYWNKKSHSLVHFSEANGKLLHNTVCWISSDKSGNVWGGTYGGLVKINPKTLQTKTYNTDDGLSNNVVCSVIEDEYKQLWIATHNGLSRFDPVVEKFTNYYEQDGIQSNEFSRGSAFKAANNEIFFGGINGVTEIKRNYKDYDTYVSDVLLTDFLLFNKSVSIGEKSGKYVVLRNSIIVADTVELKEKDNVFSIGFTSNELAFQSRISYEYNMKGFDNKWIVTSPTNRGATFTNLNHGTYVFQVRAINNDVKSQTRKLTVIIHPLWYKTVVAKVIWGLLFVSFLYGIFLLYKESVKRRHLEKIDELKMQFFINISHEIKTPLTLILDPLEKLLSQKVPDKNKRLFQVMYQNANRIYRLINQLMDVRRIDKGVMLVKYQKTNFLTLLKDIAQSYENLANTKEITFNIQAEDPEIDVWIDPFNFEKVIDNLLSNAFKYTPLGGKVDIKTYTEKRRPYDVLIIDVMDSGIGLKSSEMNLIFTRFYQANTNNIQHRGGTGVGLNLAQSIVKLHKGKLTAQNRKDTSGSLFRIELPLGNEHLPKKDLIIDKNIIPAPINRMPLSSMAEINDEDSSENKRNPIYKVMVVDDDDEIREYLKSVLSNSYNVLGYSNGKEALENIEKEKPDLILSDIMMPEMDGITLCKKVKANIHTSHVPIILLTALSKEENMVEGFETGAEMYLTKPFNSRVLTTTVKSILENRRKLQMQYQTHKNWYNVEDVQIQSHDEILIQKVMTIIKDNISNPDLNVEMLADSVGISRVHMHRKLKELTNQSARDLIKEIRLKHASYLLANKKMQIGEVAFAIGFSNLSHFSKSFKLVYGVSPKEFMVNHNEE